jgi:hypothetical protein
MKYVTKHTFTYWGLIIPAIVLFFACDPAEDRTDISGTVDKSELQYTYKQLDAVSQSETTGGNLLVLSLTSSANVLWKAYSTSSNTLITTSNERVDTLDLPFGGTYKIVVYAAFKEGAVVDSFNVQATDANPKTFSDPQWSYLTNGVDGKYWKLLRVACGPVAGWTITTGMWGDDVTTWGNTWAAPDADDSCYFDLNGGYNFKHYKDGTVGTGRFTLDLDSKDLAIIGSDDLSMSIRDGSEEMAESNKSKYRLFYVSQDTLVVGQGAYYTSSRTSEDWGYFHWYLRAGAE